MRRELVGRSRDARGPDVASTRGKALLERRPLQSNGIPVLNGHARECAVGLKQITTHQSAMSGTARRATVFSVAVV